MYRMEIAKTLYYDSLPLARKGQLFTSRSLRYLYTRITRAVTYPCGLAKDLKALRLLDPPPTLFNRDNHLLKPLPHTDMLLEYQGENGEARAALLTLARGQGLEIYAFRFDADHTRWIWPLLGMRYGPLAEEVAKIAVYEPSVLAKMTPTAQKAMVQEQSAETALLIAAVSSIEKGSIKPEEQNETENSIDIDKEEAARPIKARLAPSSFARRERTQHKRHGKTKGARRL